MDDRELLELAAKAAGMKDMRYSSPHSGMVKMLDPTRPETTGSIGPDWNPLTDDGDALRLAVKLRLDISFANTYYFEKGSMTLCGQYWDSSESQYFKRFQKHEGDPDAATRRAIVRAAAEIGRSVK